MVVWLVGCWARVDRMILGSGLVGWDGVALVWGRGLEGGFVDLPHDLSQRRGLSSSPQSPRALASGLRVDAAGVQSVTNSVWAAFQHSCFSSRCSQT